VTAREEIRVPSRPVFSHAADAVKAAGFVFVAGILPADAGGALVGAGDVVAQAEHVFGELGEILAAAGSSAAGVVKVTLFLTDVSDRAAINSVRQRFFGASRPASTLVEVSSLALSGAAIEVDCVAVEA
jgi:2-iminobutanoate/2-iminopropanoate deaminase